LKLLPASGSTPASLSLTADVKGMVAGVHEARVTLRSGADALTIPVTLSITNAPTINSISPSPLPRGDSDIAVTINGGGFTSGSYVEISGTRLTTTFIDDRTLKAPVPATLLLEQRTLQLTVVNPDARSDAFAIQVASSVPTLTASGVLNAASRSTGSVAAGEIVILSGTGFGGLSLAAAPLEDGRLPTSFSNTRVLFDGVPAPILWAQPGEVAVVVPYSVANRASTEVVVEYGNSRSAPAAIHVVPSAPGLFTASGSGSGQVSAYNQDGRLNEAGAPAARGTIVTVYATGEGLTAPLLDAGSVAPAQDTPRPVLALAVEIGGVPGEVTYAGASPGQITGLLQVNVRIPDGAPVGSNIPIKLSIGSTSSAAGPTLAVN
jgi:uncharacterized protein (TIGR03437 family)